MTNTEIKKEVHDLKKGIDRTNIIYAFSLITIFASFAFLCLLFFWLLYPYEPIKFTNVPFKVLTPVVKQGGGLQYVTNYCKNTNSTAIVTRTYSNGINYIVPSTLSNRAVGCHNTTILTTVPVELPPAKYFMIMRYSYKVNPIREVEVVATSSAFQVVK